MKLKDLILIALLLAAGYLGYRYYKTTQKPKEEEPQYWLEPWWKAPPEELWPV